MNYEDDLENAIKVLKEQYEKAKNLEYVRNKIAYALYQTWKEFDRVRRKK